MLSTSEKTFSVLFFLIVIVELICGSMQSLENLHFVFKPAIVLSLLIFFWTKSQGLDKKLRLLIALALIFSLLGDILLMFVAWSPNYFITGLIAFLFAHIMYVLAFSKDRNKTLNPFGFIAVLLVYAIGLLYLLKDGLNEMLVPVIMYMVVILSMAVTAFLRQGIVSKSSYLLVFFGALMFLVSDSILALNKFYSTLMYSNISIMLTYAIAQYLIIIGIIKLSENDFHK